MTWTRLAETAAANATRIMLQQEVDWVTGDRIVLAPTGKNGNETEVGSSDLKSLNNNMVFTPVFNLAKSQFQLHVLVAPIFHGCCVYTCSCGLSTLGK